MKQRGISNAMVNFTLNYGELNGDQYFLNCKQLKRTIAQLEQEIKIAKKLIDKGGVVVIINEKSIITTYDFDSYNGRLSYQFQYINEL